MPSIEAMLITLAGRSASPPRAARPCSACVRKNGVLTLRSMTLSQPFSGNSSNSAPQAAPALLTRMSSFFSRFLISAASVLAPSTRRDVDRQRHAGRRHCATVPRRFPPGAGLARGDVDLRALCRKPAAIILPMPREPPVIRATRPLSENKSLNMMPPLSCRWFWAGRRGKSRKCHVAGRGGRVRQPHRMFRSRLPEV